MLQIVKAELAECSLPLAKELRLGSVRIRTRDVVAIRLTAEDGTIGEALGYSRGTPLFETLGRMASAAVGTDAFRRRGTIEAFLSAHVNGRPIFHRATSLIDIALWDVVANASKLPLHKMLGAVRSQVPTMVVAGYYMHDRTLTDVGREVAGLIDHGAAIVKVMLNGGDEPFDSRCLAELVRVAPGCLAADAHWSWDTIDEALRYLERIDVLGLRFLEDPFGAHRLHLLSRLKEALKTPLAVGEDVTEALALAELSRAFRLLRLDATTCGGIDVAQTLTGVAGLEGCTVLPHVFPQLHAQLAGASSAISHVEYIPPESGADPTHTLLRRPLALQHGILTIDQEPGVGLALNWEAVEAASVRHTTIARDG